MNQRTCNYSLLFLLVLLTALPLHAQRALTHADYDGWESIEDTQLSRKGSHLAVEVTPQVGDGYLLIQQINEENRMRQARATRAQFTSDEGFLAAKLVPQYDSVRKLKLADTPKKELPKDSLVLISLADFTVWKAPMVKSFQVPEEGGAWLAYLHEKNFIEDNEEDSLRSGQLLVVRNLSSGEEYTLDRVQEYTWAHEGGRLSAVREASNDSTADAGVYVFDTERGEFSPIDTGLVTYQDLVWDEPGAQLAYLATADSAEADRRHFAVKYWTPKGGVQEMITENTAGIPAGWWISEHQRPVFSENGRRLYVGTAPMPVKYAYEEDSTLLEDERPGVDVWNWQDLSLQPRQLLQADQERKRSYLGVYWLKEGKYVQVADEAMPEVMADPHKNTSVWMGLVDAPYQKSYSWDWPWRRDVYAVDLKTGVKTRVYEAATGFAQVSPMGKYFYWFEAEADSSWVAYDVAAKQMRRISDGIPYPLYNELNDIPALPSSYGAAGWLEDDAAFWLYDAHDVWQVDPTGKKAPLNLTGGQGRERDFEFRVRRLNWDGEPYFPKNETHIVFGLNRKTKASGLYLLDPKKQALTELAYGDKLYSDVEKPAEAKSLIFSQQTFRDFPDIYAADWKLNNVEQVTDLNAQQADIRWGSTELVEYTSLQGQPLQGVLYKPDGFDPSKKYPMIVYFYERTSERLHLYQRPRPSSSTINFAWAVSNGYLVFMPDIAYQEGLPGPSAYDCIVPGTQAVIDQGFVQEDAIGLQGQSWGGYQVAYLVTRTNLYACASAGAIVANMTSAYGGIRWGSGLNRAFQYERTQSRIGGSLWEARDLYIENSPLFFADRVETPLLLMHNDKDSAVPWYQGIEMFSALRRLNKPVWMVVYNGEPHNLRERRNRMDLSWRMGQFFDHYLKGAPMPLWMDEGIPAKDKGRYLGYEESLSEEILEEEE